MPTAVSLVTPERVLFEGEGDFVVLRAEGGDIMFLPNHADFVGAVDICVVRVAPVTESGGAHAGGHGEAAGGAAGAAAGAHHEVRAAVHGGFVHVAANKVTVLAPVAELAREIDVERARRALDAAEAAVAQSEEASSGAQARGPAPAPGEPGPEHGEPAAEGPGGPGVEESPAMLALLHPDAPEVRLRRARARLEAAGALEGAGSGQPAH